MIHRVTATILLASMLSFSQLGCIGQMALVGEVQKVNLAVSENKWVREVVFLVLHIIPVYEFAAMIDYLVINSIEFHSGTNPITDKPRIALRDGANEIVAADGTRASLAQSADGTVDVRVTDAAGESYEVRLVPVPGAIEAQDTDGKVLGRVDADGTLHSDRGSFSLYPGS